MRRGAPVCRPKVFRWLGLVLAGATLGASWVWGCTIRDDQLDSSYLALGASPDYNCVGIFTSGGGYTGCGTLIAPDWVLTAAHLIISSSQNTFTVSGTTYAADHVITCPGWNPANVLGGADFSLAHLSKPVPNITPAAIYTQSLEPLQIGTIVGYGMTGTGLTGAIKADSKKRAYQNVLDQNFGNPSVLLGCYFDNPHSPSDNPLPLEGCSAPGDSGGGMFLTIDSQPYLAGVVSFVAAQGGGSANSAYGNLTGFGRVSAFSSWITSSIPEPSPAALLLFALALFRRSRRALKSL